MRALQAISDPRGTVVMGFLNRDVYYLRIIGAMSAELGLRCAALLRRQLGGGSALKVFFDFASAEASDFAAQSAFRRALLANRRQLATVSSLVGLGPMAIRARAMGTILGATLFYDDPTVFHATLLDAAPFAQARLPESRWVKVMPSMRPPSRSTRPRARIPTYA